MLFYALLIQQAAGSDAQTQTDPTWYGHARRDMPARDKLPQGKRLRQEPEQSTLNFDELDNR